VGWEEEGGCAKRREREIEKKIDTQKKLMVKIGKF
jgi:hypothetical protein